MLPKHHSIVMFRYFGSDFAVNFFFWYLYLMNIINVNIIKISLFYNFAFITVRFPSHSLTQPEGFLTQPKHVADFYICNKQVLCVAEIYWCICRTNRVKLNVFQFMSFVIFMEATPLCLLLNKLHLFKFDVILTVHRR